MLIPVAMTLGDLDFTAFTRYYYAVGSIMNGAVELVARGRVETARNRLRDYLRNLTGWALEWLRVPARLKPFEFVDPDTNETFYVYTDRLYSVVCVGQRRFYFDRVTGAYDGTSLSLPDLVTGRVEF